MEARNVRIAIVDDDDAIRNVMCDLMSNAGYDVYGVADSTSTVEILKENPVDLVITDIFMPEKDGFEVIEELREEFPKIKIMAITGGGMLKMSAVTVELIKHAAVDAYLEKPFRTDEFLKEVEQLVESISD